MNRTLTLMIFSAAFLSLILGVAACDSDDGHDGNSDSDSDTDSDADTDSDTDTDTDSDADECADYRTVYPEQMNQSQLIGDPGVAGDEDYSVCAPSENPVLADALFVNYDDTNILMSDVYKNMEYKGLFIKSSAIDCVPCQQAAAPFGAWCDQHPEIMCAEVLIGYLNGTLSSVSNLASWQGTYGGENIWTYQDLIDNGGFTDLDDFSNYIGLNCGMEGVPFWTYIDLHDAAILGRENQTTDVGPMMDAALANLEAREHDECYDELWSE